MNIVFTDTVGVDELYFPKPSSNFVPEWYKQLGSYVTGKKIIHTGKHTVTNASIKKCMPVFDSIVAGYIIPTPCDVYVSQVPAEENPEITRPYYEWSNYGIIEFHPTRQAPTHPLNSGTDTPYPKWLNPWSIRTPKGYSTLFVQPFHRDSIFTILPGVVDTDKYSAPVNFPFVLNDWKFEGLIPAGTPMAQVIPFKRDSWKISFGKEKEYKIQEKEINLKQSRFFDSYKTFFRQPKTYK